MGKYTELKKSGNLAKFQEEPEWQSKVDEQKRKMNLAHMTRASIASELSDLKKDKQKLGDQIKDLNIQIAACEQVIIAQLEDADETSFRCEAGTVFLEDEPFARTVDRQQLFAWIKKKRMIDLLTVNHQTLNAVVKERLLEGKDIPPGVSVWMCTSLGLRRS